MVQLGDDDRVAGAERRPRARARWNVRVVMLGPKAISAGEALRKSARACRAASERRRSRHWSGNAQWVLALW